MKYLLMGHSDYGQCLYNTVKFFKNDIDNVSFINDDEHTEHALIEYLNNCEDQLIVFTDLLGGSINAMVMKYIKEFTNMKVVAGANVSLILECLFSDPETVEQLSEIIEMARSGMVYVNDLIKGFSHD